MIIFTSTSISLTNVDARNIEQKDINMQNSALMAGWGQSNNPDISHMGVSAQLVLQVLPFSTLTSVLHLKDSRQSN